MIILHLLLVTFCINLALSSGANVTEQPKLCTRMENYNVTVPVTEEKIIRVCKYEWCASAPQYRCSKYVDQVTVITRNETTEHVRTIPSCCIGFEESTDGENCLPAINSGYSGPNCSFSTAQSLKSENQTSQANESLCLQEMPTTLKFQIEFMLSEWTSLLKIEMSKTFSEVLDKYEKLENERETKIKLPLCPDTTRALDILLDNMATQLSQLRVQNGTVFPAHSLQRLDQFRKRTVYFGSEIRTEPVSLCSRYLQQKLGNITSRINEIESNLSQNISQ